MHPQWRGGAVQPLPPAKGSGQRSRQHQRNTRGLGRVPEMPQQPCGGGSLRRYTALTSLRVAGAQLPTPLPEGQRCHASGEQMRPESDSAVRQNLLYYMRRFGNDATDVPGHYPLYPPVAPLTHPQRLPQGSRSPHGATGCDDAIIHNPLAQVRRSRYTIARAPTGRDYVEKSHRHTRLQRWSKRLARR